MYFEDIAASPLSSFCTAGPLLSFHLCALQPSVVGVGFRPSHFTSGDHNWAWTGVSPATDSKIGSLPHISKLIFYLWTVYLVKTQGRRWLSRVAWVGCRARWLFLLRCTWQPYLCLLSLMVRNTRFCKITEKRCMKCEEYFDAKKAFKRL